MLGSPWRLWGWKRYLAAHIELVFVILSRTPLRYWNIQENWQKSRFFWMLSITVTLWLRCCNCDWDLRCSLKCLLYVLVRCWYLLIQTWKDDCCSRGHKSSRHVSLYHLVVILSMFIKTHVFYFKDCQSDLPNSQPSGFPGGGGSFRELWHTGLADVGMPMSPGQMCCRCSSWNNIWLVKFCKMRAFSGILDTKFRTCSLLMKGPERLQSTVLSTSSLAVLGCRGDTRELFFDRSKLHPRGMDQVQNLGSGHQILRYDKLPKLLQPLATLNWFEMWKLWRWRWFQLQFSVWPGDVF